MSSPPPNESTGVRSWLSVEKGLVHAVDGDAEGFGFVEVYDGKSESGFAVVGVGAL